MAAKKKLSTGRRLGGGRRSGLDCLKGLRALADPNRLRMLDRISKSPANVGEIARACGMTGYNASRHLAVLHRAGLVKRAKKGQQRVYALSEACAVRMDHRRRTLDLGCCLFRLDAMLSD